MDFEPVYWQYLAIFLLAAIGAWSVFALWTKRSKFQERLIELYAVLTKWGMDELAMLIKAILTENWIGAQSVTRIARQLIHDLLDGGLDKMLLRVFWKMLPAVIQNAELKQRVLDIVNGVAEKRLPDPTPGPTVLNE